MNSNLMDECLARLPMWKNATATMDDLPVTKMPGSFEWKANASDVFATAHIDESITNDRGFMSSNLTFTDTCGTSSSVFPTQQAVYSEPIDYAATKAIVVTITSLAKSDSDGTLISLAMESCDGKKSVDAAATGVYVIDTPLVAFTVQRSHPNGSLFLCKGENSIQYEIALLETYCKQDVGASLPQCESVGNTTTTNSTTPTDAVAPPTKQVPSSATFFKLSLSVTMFSACAMVAAAML